MDMLTIDLTDIPEAQLGDNVILWGKDLTASEIARHADTIPYQLFCNFNRVPVEYTQTYSTVENPA